MSAVRQIDVSMDERQLAIRIQPCFGMLTQSEVRELANFLQVETFISGQNIVEESALVDRVYFILEGQAEVSRLIKETGFIRKKERIEILAVLGPQDSIGLSDTGLFSKTGQRTASINAITAVKTLSLSLKDLHDFLQKHPGLATSLQAQANWMLKIRLIKQSLPFVKLSIERIRELAKLIQEVKFPAGFEIFHQGEKGDKCYLIESGHVEVIIQDADNTEKVIATLKESILFGETSMMLNTVRNASARTKDDCQLLVLEHRHLKELMETEKQIASMFMILMVDRSRPAQNPRVSVHPRNSADGEDFYILKNPDNGKYFKLSREGWFIWQQINTRQTMQAITMALANEMGVFSPDIVAGLISQLAKGGFVKEVPFQQTEHHEEKTFLHRMISLVKKYTDIRYVFGDADSWLTDAYQRFVYLIFTRIGKGILALIAIAGLIMFAISTSSTVDTFRILPNVWWIPICLIPFTVVSMALHELGHAFATKAFGYEVHYMGVGWFWFSPVAFTDTSDMWLSTKIPRVKVNLAGVFMDVVVAGFSSLSLLVIDNPYIQAFCWLFALFTYINAFRMMSPLQELDGYYVLMDLVDKPHLKQNAIIWLVKKFPECLRNRRLFKRYYAEVSYWIACLVFLVLVSFMTVFVQGFIMDILGLHHNVWLALLLPFLVILLSSIGVVEEIRKQD